MEEASIVVPLTLHISGFSPSETSKYKQFPTIHFDSRRFPTIHVEGRMGGAHWNLSGDGDVRRVKGTVKVCGDGSIWWSMVRSVSTVPLCSNRDLSVSCRPSKGRLRSGSGARRGCSSVRGFCLGLRLGCARGVGFWVCGPVGSMSLGIRSGHGGSGKSLESWTGVVGTSTEFGNRLYWSHYESACTFIVLILDLYVLWSRSILCKSSYSA